MSAWKLDRDEGEALWFFANLMLVKVSKEQARGHFSLLDSIGARGDMAPLHLHEKDDEFFYVLEGEIDYWVGDAEPVRAGPGALVYAPRGIPHTYRVESESGARWLVLTGPGDFEPFVTALGRPAEAPTLPPPTAPPTPEQAEGMVALAHEHGISILGPPGMLPSELS